MHDGRENMGAPTSQHRKRRSLDQYIGYMALKSKSVKLTLLFLDKCFHKKTMWENRCNKLRFYNYYATVKSEYKNLDVESENPQQNNLTILHNIIWPKIKETIFVSPNNNISSETSSNWLLEHPCVSIHDAFAHAYSYCLKNCSDAIFKYINL